MPHITLYNVMPHITLYNVMPSIKTYNVMPSIITYNVMPSIITYNVMPSIITYNVWSGRHFLDTLHSHLMKSVFFLHHIKAVASLFIRSGSRLFTD